MSPLAAPSTRLPSENSTSPSRTNTTAAKTSGGTTSSRRDEVVGGWTLEGSMVAFLSSIQPQTSNLILLRRHPRRRWARRGRAVRVAHGRERLDRDVRSARRPLHGKPLRPVAVLEHVLVLDDDCCR